MNQQMIHQQNHYRVQYPKQKSIHNFCKTINGSVHSLDWYNETKNEACQNLDINALNHNCSNTSLKECMVGVEKIGQIRAGTFRLRNPIFNKVLCAFSTQVVSVWAPASRHFKRRQPAVSPQVKRNVWTSICFAVQFLKGGLFQACEFPHHIHQKKSLEPNCFLSLPYHLSQCFFL